MMRDQGGERSLYLIPRNVETRFQFFPGFGWFEVGMVVLAFLAGLLFTGFFSLFTEKIFRFVFEAELPAVDADFARALGIEDGDVQKLRDEIRASLERELKQRLDADLKKQVFDLLLAAHEFAVPSALVELEAEQLLERAKRDLQMRGFDANQLKLSPAFFEEEAQRRVRLGLLIGEIVKRHELNASPEQVRAFIEEMASEYERPQEVVDWYHADRQRLAAIEAVVIEDNVVQWVLERVRVTEKTVDFDEFMAQKPV